MHGAGGGYAFLAVVLQCSDTYLMHTGMIPRSIKKRTKAYRMTYQTASQTFAAQIPARGMSINSAPFMNARTAFSQLVEMFKAIGTSIINATEASSRITRVEALRAKSDAELAAMGIKRDDIVHHVFKDLYYM